MSFNKYIIAILLFAIVLHLPILMINTPLWDDWILEGLGLQSLAKQFKGNGLYYGGLAHLHHFINLVDGNDVWFSRLLSLVCLVTAPLFTFTILKEFLENKEDAFYMALIFISVPVFGNAFGQIVLPYLICLNLFLGSIILTIKYLKHTKSVIYLAGALVLLFISFITNSIIFFGFFSVIIVSSYFWIKEKDWKRPLIVVASSFSIVILFLVYKSLLLVSEEGGAYASSGYNSFGLIDLIFHGPLRTLKHLVLYPKYILADVVNIFKYTSNWLLAITLTLVFALLLKKLKINISKSGSKTNFRIMLAIGFFLLLASVYPYAVVGKLSLSLYSVNERHNLLVPIAVSLILIPSLRLLITKPSHFQYFFCVVFSLFLVIKLNVFGFYIVESSVQEKIGEQITKFIHEEGLNNQSMLFINEEPEDQLTDWRFYEYGGIIRVSQLQQNKVFVPSKYISFDAGNRQRLNISGRTKLFLESQNYGISEFDTTVYVVSKYCLAVDDLPEGNYVTSIFHDPDVNFKVVN